LWRDKSSFASPLFKEIKFFNWKNQKKISMMRKVMKYNGCIIIYNTSMLGAIVVVGFTITYAISA
jgi:hypothetical protein